MSEFTANEWLAVAKHVYPDPDNPWKVGNRHVFYEAHGTYDFDEVYFRPSITGTEREQAQALRVIVAADKLNGCFVCDFAINRTILDGAISAILSHLGVR